VPGTTGARDAAEIADILWAHATEADRLEHVAGVSHRDHVDLLLFLRQNAHDPSDLGDVLATALLARCHAASPLLGAAFHPPAPAQVPLPPPPGSRRGGEGPPADG
jgi:hypothetical protein